jgi:hypothetical protein
MDDFPDITTESDRRGRIRHWVRRGNLVVELEVDVVYLGDAPDHPAFEARTARFLDEVGQRAEAGDITYLQTVGTVFRQIDQPAAAA